MDTTPADHLMAEAHRLGNDGQEPSQLLCALADHPCGIGAAELERELDARGLQQQGSDVSACVRAYMLCTIPMGGEASPRAMSHLPAGAGPPLPGGHMGAGGRAPGQGGA